MLRWLLLSVGRTTCGSRRHHVEIGHGSTMVFISSRTTKVLLLFGADNGCCHGLSKCSVCNVVGTQATTQNISRVLNCSAADIYATASLPYLLRKVLDRTKALMAQGLVRKLFVCFFQEGEHVDQAPVERVVFEVQIDGGSDGCAHGRGETGRKWGEDNALDPTRLQVCTSSTVLV